MPTLYRDCPPELSSAVDRSRHFHEIAWQHGPEKEVPNTLRMHTFSGFLTTLFEHHDSTVLLLETGRNDASAFALARVIVETFYRGLWLYLCASDTEVEQIRGGGEPYPRFVEMTQAVDGQLGDTGKLEIGRPIWGLLNGFTHTGLEQLSRRFDEGGDLRPSYTLDEVLTVLDSASLLLSLMAQLACVVSKRPEDAECISDAWKTLSRTADVETE